MVPPQRLWVFSISTAPVWAKCSPAGRMVASTASGESTPKVPGERAKLQRRQGRRRAPLVVQDVGVLVDDDLVPHAGERAQAELVAHGARGHEEGGFLAQHVGHHLLEPVDGGILAVDVVPHRRLGHGAAHGVARPGDGVAAQVDRALGYDMASSLPRRGIGQASVDGDGRPGGGRLPGGEEEHGVRHVRRR